MSFGASSSRPSTTSSSVYVFDSPRFPFLSHNPILNSVFAIFQTGSDWFLLMRSDCSRPLFTFPFCSRLFWQLGHFLTPGRSTYPQTGQRLLPSSESSPTVGCRISELLKRCPLGSGGKLFILSLTREPSSDALQLQHFFAPTGFIVPQKLQRISPP